MDKAPAQLRSLMTADPALTLAVAESLTSGRLQAAIGAGSGASDFFLGGMTAYTIAQKVRHLGVDANEAQSTNGVSAMVADAMALGACRLFGSDLGLATTGYAEPWPEKDIAVPKAYWSIADRRTGTDTIADRGFLECPGLDRVAMQKKVVSEVLGALVKWLKTVRNGA